MLVGNCHIFMFLCVIEYFGFILRKMKTRSKLYFRFNNSADCKYHIKSAYYFFNNVCATDCN